MRGAIARAQELAASTPNSWIPQQFENPANPEIHEKTTGKEIWDDTGGKVDMIVAGVGTGGTITGVTRYLRARNPTFQAYAVEPVDSPVISGGKPGPHKIQGHRRRFHPQEPRHQPADRRGDGHQRRGVYLGPAFGPRGRHPVPALAPGANVAVAARLAARPENRGKVIVTVAASFGERYLSTPLFEGLTSR